jgi:predicted nuclease of predicted toxin-antitoxin system
MLIDENIPKDVEEWLFMKGFETVNVSKLGLRSAKDNVVAEYAVKNKLSIITLDKGFAQLYRTFQKGTLLTVIIVKANPPTPINIIETLKLAQNKINLKEIQNRLVIITKRKIRIIT